MSRANKRLSFSSAVLDDDGPMPLRSPPVPASGSANAEEWTALWEKVMAKGESNKSLQQ
jgi:hypothetical protein